MFGSLARRPAAPIFIHTLKILSMLTSAFARTLGSLQSQHVLQFSLSSPKQCAEAVARPRRVPGAAAVGDTDTFELDSGVEL